MLLKFHIANVFLLNVSNIFDHSICAKPNFAVGSIFIPD